MYTGDGVMIGQPVCTSGPTIVETQPVIVETVSGPQDEPADRVVTRVEEPEAMEPLPQLRVGQPFELPAGGLGADEGRVVVAVGPVIIECPLTGWDESGLSATMPDMMLTTSAKADLLVSFADGSLAAAVPVLLVPADSAP